MSLELQVTLSVPAAFVAYTHVLEGNVESAAVDLEACPLLPPPSGLHCNSLVEHRLTLLQGGIGRIKLSYL